MKAEKKETISENFSEKKKRGRPRLLRPDDEQTYRRSQPSCDIRTLHNQDYEVRAMRVLGLNKVNPPDYPFSWLGDRSKIKADVSARRFYRKTILAELGRFKSDKKLIKAATEICRLKPKTQDAIKMIRGWRLGRVPSSVSLESIFRKAIEDYRKQHPDVTDAEIYETISSLDEEYLQKSMFGNQES